MSKKAITVRLRDDQLELIDDMADDDDPRYDSRSEVVRYFLDRVDELEDEVEELERHIERIRNEKQALVNQHQQTKELQVYREEESLLDASLSQRLKWLVFGRDNDE